MTDSLNEQLGAFRREPTPDWAYPSPAPAGQAVPPSAPAGQAVPPSAPAGQAVPSSAQRGLPPRQFVSARRLREEFGVRAPYSEGKRIFYGLLWTGWTLLLTIAGFSLLPHGSTVLSGLISFALAIITGRYAYRIWTWQARRLIFFIVW